MRLNRDHTFADLLHAPAPASPAVSPSGCDHRRLAGDACVRDRLDRLVNVFFGSRPVRDRDAEERFTSPRRCAEPAGAFLLEALHHPLRGVGVTYADEHLVEDDFVDDFDPVERVEPLLEAAG